jgi:hypothetical protein
MFPPATTRSAPARIGRGAAWAGVTGIEPAASGFGDRRSGQLSYTPPAVVSMHHVTPPHHRLSFRRASWQRQQSPGRAAGGGGDRGHPHHRASTKPSPGNAPPSSTSSLRHAPGTRSAAPTTPQVIPPGGRCVERGEAGQRPPAPARLGAAGSGGCGGAGPAQPAAGDGAVPVSAGVVPPWLRGSFRLGVSWSMSGTSDVARVQRGRSSEHAGEPERPAESSFGVARDVDRRSPGTGRSGVSGRLLGSFAGHCRLCVRQREQITVIRVKEA